MADEILPAGLGDITASEEVATEFLYLLAERDDNILTHPALFQATGDGTSNVVRVPHLGLAGYNILAATTPGSEIANTALSTGYTDVTIAARAKRYELNDLARFMAGGMLDPSAFAMDAAIAVAQTLISLIANVADDFSGSVGTSGVNATWDDVLDAKTALAIAKAVGAMLGLVHPQQWGDLERDALSLGLSGAMAVAGTLNAGLTNSKGRWMGVDFFAHTAVPTADAGANRAGGIFTRGAIAWADAQMRPENDPNIADLGRARLERVRRGTYLQTAWVVSSVMGVAKAIDAAGQTFKTDA